MYNPVSIRFLDHLTISLARSIASKHILSCNWLRDEITPLTSLTWLFRRCSLVQVRHSDAYLVMDAYARRTTIVFAIGKLSG